MSSLLYAGVSLGGALGAAARLVADDHISRRWRRPLPLATMLINISGSLILGVLTGGQLHHGWPERITAFAGAGFCGGFTTFSTASVETVRLLQRGAARLAAVQCFGGALGCLAAAALGLAVAS